VIPRRVLFAERGTDGHRDFVFATKNRALQLRYLVRLYVKELVLRNFTGVSTEQLLERMVELFRPRAGASVYGFIRESAALETRNRAAKKVSEVT
jgi:hypothetical protein